MPASALRMSRPDHVARLRDIFNDDNVAVVKEGDRVTGILTKIDLIEFLGQKLR